MIELLKQYTKDANCPIVWQLLFIPDDID